MRQLLINISRTADAWQSSRCRFSIGSDADRAIALEPNGSYHFHTDLEIYPWWEVSLGCVMPVSKIEIFNRDENEAIGHALRERAYPMLIDYSIDSQNWIRLAEINYAFGGVNTNMPLRLEFPKAISMECIRLRLMQKNYLHLDAVKIFASAAEITTKSQIEQERWVFAMSGGRRSGRFIEIGAFDGVYCSNTYHLETDFHWTGVEIEANPLTFAQLQANRRAVCLNKAVYNKTGGIVSFVPCGDVGTIVEFAEADIHAPYRRNAIKTEGLIQVETITFDDIVKIQDFSTIGFDYASIDTEGSELEIIKTIDLKKYKIPLFTIEHNYVSDRRELIKSYMLDGGYKVVPVAFDDWFYNEMYLEERNNGFIPDIEEINNFFAQRYA